MFFNRMPKRSPKRDPRILMVTPRGSVFQYLKRILLGIPSKKSLHSEADFDKTRTDQITKALEKYDWPELYSPLQLMAIPLPSGTDRGVLSIGVPFDMQLLSIPETLSFLQKTAIRLIPLPDVSTFDTVQFNMNLARMGQASVLRKNKTFPSFNTNMSKTEYAEYFETKDEIVYDVIVRIFTTPDRLHLFQDLIATDLLCSRLSGMPTIEARWHTLEPQDVDLSDYR